MKKALIAGAASTIALAAMPMAGVFADDTISMPSRQVTDDVTLTVQAGCTMTRTGLVGEPDNVTGGYTQTMDDPVTATPTNPITNTVAFGTVAPGGVASQAGKEVTATCNDESTLNATAKTWLLQAAGTSVATGDGITNTIGALSNSLIKWNSGTAEAYIPTGTDLDGDTSNWAFKIAEGEGSGNADNFEIATGYSDFIAVPESPATIATMTYVNGANVYKFTPTYKVSVSQDQASGSYLGHVTYTIIANPAS